MFYIFAAEVLVTNTVFDILAAGFLVNNMVFDSLVAEFLAKLRVILHLGCRSPCNTYGV